MTALTMDQYLEVEALLYPATRSGAEYAIKPVLLEVVECADDVLLACLGHSCGEPGCDGSGGLLAAQRAGRRLEELLYPVAGSDERCRAAVGMLGAAMVVYGRRRLRAEGGGVALTMKVTHDGMADRRFQLAQWAIQGHALGRGEAVWQVLVRQTTEVRCSVLGVLAMMLREAVTGGLTEHHVGHARTCG